MANEVKGKEKDKDKAAKPKGNFSNLIIIILLVLILVLVGGFAAYSVFFNKGKNNVSSSKNETTIVTVDSSTISEYTYDMKDDFVGNLADDNGKKSYIKAKISLGYNTKETSKMTKELTDKNAEARDVIYSVLLTKKASDLNPAGREATKKEIIDRLKTVFISGQINNVYFYNIVIQ